MQKQSEPEPNDTLEIICPICQTKYHLGVDSFITTEDDTRAMLAGTRAVIGNVNVIREDLIRKNGNDLTVDRETELNEETKRKIKKIKEDLKKGIDRKWFCRKCGGPEKGTNPYFSDVAEPKPAQTPTQINRNLRPDDHDFRIEKRSNVHGVIKNGSNKVVGVFALPQAGVVDAKGEVDRIRLKTLIAGGLTERDNFTADCYADADSGNLMLTENTSGGWLILFKSQQVWI